MIDNYDDIMAQWANSQTPCATNVMDSEVAHEWAAPCQGSCTNMMEVIPAEDFTRWAVQRVVTVLANSDYYYTKAETESLIRQITANTVTRQEVEIMIQRAIADKADKAVVDALAEQVRQNTERLFNTYTKQETNALLTNYLSKLEATRIRDNYSKVEGETLILNSEFGITI